MKNIFVSLAILSTSISALACPNLSGKYACQTSDGRFVGDLRIKQDDATISWTVDRTNARGPYLWNGSITQTEKIREFDKIVSEGNCTDDKLSVTVTRFVRRMTLSTRTSFKLNEGVVLVENPELAQGERLVCFSN